MNDIITMYISGESKGLDYNPMYKFNSFDEFFKVLDTGKLDLSNDTKVVEAYRGDNLIYINGTLTDFIYTLELLTKQ